jgi:hypothetical protein
MRRFLLAILLHSDFYTLKTARQSTIFVITMTVAGSLRQLPSVIARKCEARRSNPPYSVIASQ